MKAARAESARRVLSRRDLVVTCLAAVALLLIAAAAATPARAAEKPLALDFDQSSIDAGFLGTVAVDELSGPSSIAGTIDDNGDIKIAKGDFQLPVLDVSSVTRSLAGIESPVAIQGFMSVEQPATGNFDEKTGAMQIETKAGLWVSVNVQQLLGALGGLGVSLPTEISGIAGLLGENLTCGFSPMDVTFTTGSTSLGSGQPFSQGLDGPGALTGEWSQLGPFAGKTKILGFVDACTTIRGLLPGLLSGIGGETGGLPGGLDLSALLAGLDELDLGPSALTITRTLDESAPAKLKLSVSPKRRSSKAGRAIRYRVTVRNRGGSPASRVRLCARAPKKAVRGGRCANLGTIAAGRSKRATFRLKLAPGASRRVYRVPFRLRADGGISGSASGWIASSGR